jgi:large subunit ribosomal protein L3
VVVQISKIKKDNQELTAVQLGFGEKKEWRLSKPQAGHVKNLAPMRWLKTFITSDAKETLKRGDTVLVDTFLAGDKVTVVGISKGKGFAGVVKRHHFGGGPASHGHKDNLRMPGSIGAGGVQRVFKGMRMAGRMGGDRVTVKNLEIIEIHPETNELYIKGAVPGGRNGLLLISTEGELKVTEAAVSKETAIAPSEVVESAPVETISENSTEQVSEEPKEVKAVEAETTTEPKEESKN